MRPRPLSAETHKYVQKRSIGYAVHFQEHWLSQFENAYPDTQNEGLMCKHPKRGI